MMKSSDGFLNYFQINSKHARVFSLSLSLSLSGNYGKFSCHFALLRALKCAGANNNCTYISYVITQAETMAPNFPAVAK